MTPDMEKSFRIAGSDHGAPAADTPKKPFRFGMVAKVTTKMIIVGLFPLILFGALTLVQQGDRLRDEARTSIQASTERIAMQVDEWVDKNVRALETAASLPAMTGMQREDQTKVLTAMARGYPWMYLVHTMTPGGMDVARSDNQPLISYADRQYLKDLMAGRSVAWETVIGKTSKKPALILAVPIRTEAGVVGVISAAISVEDMSRIVVNWKAGATGYAFLVDDTGKVIAHPREEYAVTQRHLDKHPLVSAFAADGKPHLASFSSDGNEAMGYVQGNRFHWAVAAQQDLAELLAPQRQTLTLGLWLLGAAIALVVLIAVWASKTLVRPIVDMTRAAEAMSLGELDTPMPKVRTKDELGMLAKSLERLRRSMAAAMARL
jgi:methyl-accepting chemotaxis protein